MNPVSPVIDVFSSQAGQGPEFAGTIGLPVRDHLNAATATSLMTIDYSFAEGKTVARHIIQGGILTLQRNELIQRMEGEWLLFIDDDMVFQGDAPGRLVRSWERITEELGTRNVMLGGLCFRRTPPYSPTLYMREQPTDGRYNFLETWDPDALVEVDATGAAFLLVPVEVFEAIAETPMPPLEVRKSLGIPPNFFKWDGPVGEDLRFCQDAKAAGTRIFVDTSIAVGHVSEVVIGEREYLTQIATRSPEVEAHRREVNESFGLPTLSQGAARERLGW